ncbi:DUF927 domain-containing protein [uncultured Sutterella sp.]|uniref:DUF927 domain-containing protein n=1 Tax=uncultured Sutterella sp. TaxID=286133 RepID=UPI00266F3D97|nr:DUF927 domain-containing protein [uncultured Sutterella sp.]
MNKSITEHSQSFLFGLGKNSRDSLPVTHTADGFESFVSCIRELPRGAEKDGLYVSSAFTRQPGESGRRKNENAQPLPVLFLDVDDATPEQAEALPEKLKGLNVDAFTYPSFTDGAPKYETAEKAKEPGQTFKDIRAESGRVFPHVLHDAEGRPIEKAPACARFRVVLSLSRAPSQEERVSLMHWAASKLGVHFDGATTDAARLYYTPRANCKDVDFKRYSGKPLDVEAALHEAALSDSAGIFGAPPPVTAPAPLAVGTAVVDGPITAEGESTDIEEWDDSPSDALERRFDITPVTRPEEDPVLKRLYALGMVIGPSSKKKGAFDIRCPFEHEHTTEGGARDTLYYAKGSAENTDHSGKPFKLGRFHCMHSCTERHSQAEYFLALSLAYNDTCRVWKGESTALFFGSKGRRFHTDANGTVTVRIPGGVSKGVEAPATFHKVCFGLKVLGSMSDDKGGAQKLRLQFRDDVGRTHFADIPRSGLAARDSAPVLSPLIDEGLQIASRDAGGLLIDYLFSFPSGLLPRFIGVDALGWYRASNGQSVFILSEETIYPCTPSAWRGPAVVYSGTKDKAAKLASRGTLAQWKERAAGYCRYSSRMTLAVCAAFAAPCLALMSAEGGAFNIYGPSSRGKSLSLKLAASVFGRGDMGKEGSTSGYVETWQGSVVGHEQACIGHNDLPLILDEAAMCPEKERGDKAYIFANGREKKRGGISANGEIDVRKSHSWRTLGLSSAEMTAERWIKAGRWGNRAYAGQLTRFTDVYACPVNDDLGVFETLPEGMSGGEAAHAIENAAVECYGTAGREWLQYLTEHREEAKEALAASMKAFRARFKADLQKGQFARVLDRFALCAAAGELATSIGLTGWEAPEFGKDFIAEQIYACARDALKPFRVGHERLNDVRALITMCTKESERFISTRRGMGTGTPQECYGAQWSANRDGTKYAGADGEEWPDLTGGARADTPSEDREEHGAPERTFFFHKQVFRDNFGGPVIAKGLALWLQSEGVLVCLRRKSGRNDGLSWLGKSYGLPVRETPGYCILLNRLRDLEDRLTDD